MKNFQARTEDKLRVLSNLTSYSLYKTKKLFSKKPELPKDIKNILIIELKRIGDIIVATPAIRALKKNFPDANIDIVIPNGMGQVLEGNPNLNKIITWNSEKIEENYQDYLEDLKKTKYDLGIILHNGTYTVSKMLKEADIPYRIGCTRVGFKEPKGYFLTKQLLPDRKLKHKIDDNLDVLKLIDINSKDDSPEIFVSKKAELSINKKLAENKISSKDKVAVLHMVSWTHPTWFKERFAELADKLIENYKVKILFTGTNKEKDFIDSVKSLIVNKKDAVWLGEISIQELFALINRGDITIGIDSSATNIAAALNKPVVALFGAGDSEIWGPRSPKAISIQKKHEVCTACMKSQCKYNNDRNLECMKAISVDEILNAVYNLKTKHF